MSIEVPRSMSLSNSKFTPLIKDGTFHFTEENMKRNSTAPVDPNSSSSSYSLYQTLYPSSDAITAARQNIVPFGASISPFVNANMMMHPMVHPYLLESMQHADHLSGTTKQPFNPRLFSLPGQVENYLDIGPHPRRKNATRETTSILKAWLNEHQKNPYPTKGEKIMLAVITKMTLTQVSTWFANARRRLKKENKMTWSPNHKSDDEMDDLDDGDSSELLNNISQEIGSQSTANEFLLKFSDLRGDSHQPTLETSVNSSKSENTKPKIWSIADIASDNYDSDQSKTSVALHRDLNLSQTLYLPNTQSQSMFLNPTMQYLLWKHKEFYQLQFSSMFSQMNRYRPTSDFKGRLPETEDRPQDTDPKV